MKLNAYVEYLDEEVELWHLLHQCLEPNSSNLHTTLEIPRPIFQAGTHEALLAVF